MKVFPSARVLAGVFTIAVAVAPALAQTPAPPVANVVPKVDTIHGDVMVDNYFWIRNRQDPEVITHLEAENAYTAAVTKHIEPLQETLYKEMLGRIKQTDLSVPVRRDSFYYYTRTEEGKQYQIHARKKGSLEAPEEILLDENVMAAGKRYFRLGGTAISPDHRLYAFLVDTAGSEHFTLVVKNIARNAMLPDQIADVHFGLVWANDNRTIFYTRTDSAQRPDRIFRHTLGMPGSSDVMVHSQPDVLFGLGVTKTKDQRYVLIGDESFTQSTWYYVDAFRPGDSVKVIAAGRPDVEYSVEHHGTHFYIRTNDGATNFKLVRAPDRDPRPSNWQTVIPQRDSVLLADFDVFRNHLVLLERENALTRIRIRELATGKEHNVAMDEPVYTVRWGGNPEFNTRTLRYMYTSLVTPMTVYDYDMQTKDRELRKRTDVLGGYDPSQYGTERTWAKAPDGIMVPVSLVYRKPLVKDGSRPMLLYSYGSYGSSTDPTFSSNNLSLLDRGFIYAIAHIRGGQEMGRWWYDQGKMLNKKNTFTDFIASAEHLIREKYTSKDRLAIRGGSAGGLLMGAVVTMRPDLFKAVVADVPFVDVINTMMDASIPLTAGEWQQWGDPHVKEHYVYMKSYSPYDNVQRVAYPAMLVTTGLNDPRVAYWEPAKWVAKLRAHKTDGNMLILKTNMGAGHGGSSGRYDNLRELAFRYAFIIDQLGVTAAPSVSMP
ncbi:MAG: S9 family peptidase [Gemmatimonadaceae bacterium]